MIVLFTAVSAVVPSILFVWFFKTRDVHPEPSSVLWATFWLGVASIIPTLFVALPVQFGLQAVVPDPGINATLQAFFCAALPEEFFKLMVVWLYASRHKAFDEPMDGIVYGVVASLGFATLENILYCLQGGIGVAVMRAFTAVPMHAACGAIMGYYVGQARFPPEGGASFPWVKAFLFPVLVHGLYDAPLLWIQSQVVANSGNLPDSLAPAAGMGALGSMGVLLIGVVWALILTSRLRKEQLRLRQEGRFVLLDEEDAVECEVGEQAPIHTHRAPAEGSRSNPVLGWFLMGLGFLMASGAGLVLLGLLLAAATGGVPRDDLPALVVGGTLFGVLPLMFGALLFYLGIKKLPKARRRRSAYT